MSWTDTRVELLKKLWSKGMSASRCADELGEGATRNAVIGKINRLGLSQRRTKVRAVRRRPAFETAKQPGAIAVQSGAADYSRGAGLKLLGHAAPEPRVIAQHLPALDEPQRAEVAALPSTIPRLLDLRDEHCRYPRDGERGFSFCGRPRIDGSAYCSAHHQLCWRPAPRAPSSPEPRGARSSERRERIIDCVEAFGADR